MATVLLPMMVAAQAPSSKKTLYCWDDRGTRVCSDALPPEAINRAHQEFNANSGMQTQSVDAAMTEAELASQALALAQQRADAAATETRRRTERAMLTSYANEAELQRVFAERTALLDNNVQTAHYNIASLRQGLVTLLRMAAERELGGRPVDAQLSGQITERHRALQQQQGIAERFEAQRASLSEEVVETLLRYKEMKQSAASGA